MSGAMRLLSVSAMACAVLPAIAMGGGGGAPRRTIDCVDLLQIADIGVTSEHDGDGVAVSPDHTLAALEVRRAVPGTNSVAGVIRPSPPRS